jgi:hypothetical protein
MWIELVPIRVAGGNPMQLSAPKLPNAAAAEVPGVISSARSSQRQPACTARITSRFMIWSMGER